MKKTARKIHLWIGMLSAIPVFIVCLTGALYVFKDEVEDLTQPWRFTEPSGKPVLLPSAVLELSGKVMEGGTVHALTYGEPSDALRVDGTDDAGTFFSLWLNPYEGSVQKVIRASDGSFDFFRFLMDGHRRLWLPRAIGSPIVGISVLLFMMALITGLILWWPGFWSRKTFRRLFGVKRNAGSHRLIFDLHQVVGMYAALILLLTAATGLVWSFKWYSEGVYRLTGGKDLKAYRLPKSSFPPVAGDVPDVDVLYRRLRAAEPAAKEFYFVIPRKTDDVYRVSVVHRRDSYYRTDNLFFDRYTLEELEGEGPYAGRYREAPFPDRVRRMNLEIHDGRIGGLPGKSIVFLAALVGASLPVTGWVLWRKKKRRHSCAFPKGK